MLDPPPEAIGRRPLPVATEEVAEPPSPHGRQSEPAYDARRLLGPVLSHLELGSNFARRPSIGEAAEGVRAMLLTDEGEGDSPVPCRVRRDKPRRVHGTHRGDLPLVATGEQSHACEHTCAGLEYPLGSQVHRCDQLKVRRLGTAAPPVHQRRRSAASPQGRNTRRDGRGVSVVLVDDGPTSRKGPVCRVARERCCYGALRNTGST